MVQQQKGFGFITTDDGGKDFFVHFSEDPRERLWFAGRTQRVQFEVEQGQKGPQAVRVITV